MEMMTQVNDSNIEKNLLECVHCIKYLTF